MLRLLAVGLLASVSFTTGGSSARAADALQPHAVPGFDWSGAYAGLHLGYGSSDRDWNGEFAGFPIDDELFRYDMNGALLGAQLGYNWQRDNFVFGVEADASWSDMDDALSELAADAESRVEWMATIRARAGFAWNRLFLYGTGGAAFAGVDTDVVSFNTDSASATHTGWTAGLGVEAALTRRLSLKLEYLHASFGDEEYDYNLIGGPTEETEGSAELKADTVRLGINFHF